MNKNKKTAVLIIVIGLVLCLVAHLLVSVVKTPTITEHDFDFSVTYTLNGETKTIEGVYSCKFVGHSQGEDPRERYYTGSYTIDGQTFEGQAYTIAEKDGAELYIVLGLSEHYLMGDVDFKEYNPGLDDPYLEAVTKEGYAFEEGQMPSEFTAEIVSWEYPEPLENKFVFTGFSILYVYSMLAMALAGLLTVVACLIFVKRDQTVTYNALDKLSILLNFAVCFLAIPFAIVCTFFMQLVVSGDEILYQIYLCVPAIAALTVAASVALRRNGYTKSGFFVQFIGPVLFVVPMVVESFIINVLG